MVCHVAAIGQNITPAHIEPTCAALKPKGVFTAALQALPAVFLVVPLQYECPSCNRNDSTMSV